MMVSSGNDTMLTISEKQLADMPVDHVIDAAIDASSSAGDIEVKFFVGARKCGGLGYCAFPNILLAYQNELTYTKNGEELPLEPLDICVLIQMLGFLRDGTRIVRITQTELARRLSKSTRQISRSIKRLSENSYVEKRHDSVFSEKKSYIRAGQTLVYSLTPFVSKLEFLYKKHAMQKAGYQIVTSPTDASSQSENCALDEALIE